MSSADRRRAFVRRHTSLLASSFVPEIRLHLASDAHDLWLISEEELQTIGLPPPFWAFAWAGGEGLARYVLDHPHVVQGRRVVDFASGSGLVAIAAAKAGAGSVVAYDVDAHAEVAAKMNADVNAVDVTVRSHNLVGKTVDADVLLAGDVFYDSAFAECLTPWFDDLATRGVEILIGDPGRAYLPHSSVKECTVYEVPVTRALEDSEIKRTTIWRWTVS